MISCVKYPLSGDITPGHPWWEGTTSAAPPQHRGQTPQGQDTESSARPPNVEQKPAPIAVAHRYSASSGHQIVITLLTYCETFETRKWSHQVSK